MFGLGGSDFFRSRLTHSLEVAQIGKGLALRLGADTDLVEAASLAHDIGHPPFGHVGESKLKSLMWEKGGFEANAQNLRVLCKLEVKSRDFIGMNLTNATLDALLKYKIPFAEVKGTEGPFDSAKFYYDDDEDLVQDATSKVIPRRQTFECEIMEWADDVAYSTHDLDDGIKAGLITSERLTSHEQALKESILNENLRRKYSTIQASEWEEAWQWSIGSITKALGRSGRSEIQWKTRRRETISHMITLFIRAATHEDVADPNVPPRYSRKLRIKPRMRARCEVLKGLAWQLIITEEHLATLARKAENVVSGLFDQLTTWKDLEKTIHMYPSDFRERLEKAKQERDDNKLNRIACDYIAGMTDGHALRIYSRLVQPESGTLLEFL